MGDFVKPESKSENGIVKNENSPRPDQGFCCGVFVAESIGS
jgi:hypothetical protein